MPVLLKSVYWLLQKSDVFVCSEMLIARIPAFKPGLFLMHMSAISLSCVVLICIIMTWVQSLVWKVIVDTAYRWKTQSYCTGWIMLLCNVWIQIISIVKLPGIILSWKRNECLEFLWDSPHSICMPSLCKKMNCSKYRADLCSYHASSFF